MHIHNRAFLVTAVAAALAMPALSSAQAIPRTEATSGGGSSAGSSAGTGSSGMPAPMPSMERSVPQSQPIRSAPPSGGSSGGSGSSSSGGSSTRSSGDAGSRSAGGDSSRTGAVTRGNAPRVGGGGITADAPMYVGAGSRTRDGRPIGGSAIRRPSPILGAGSGWLVDGGYPFSPWGRWYPWYTGGWGWGYVSYDPWRYGGTRWVWGRYGTWWYGATPWYDPWYDPYYGSYGMYSGGYGGGGERESYGNGSIRVKANPSKAQVYIDGVLQGVVDDFDGLSSHLSVSGGSHQIELRADGYVTLKSEINVEPGKTQTFRGSLKKSSK